MATGVVVVFLQHLMDRAKTDLLDRLPVQQLTY